MTAVFGQAAVEGDAVGEAEPPPLPRRSSSRSSPSPTRSSAGAPQALGARQRPQQAPRAPCIPAGWRRRGRAPAPPPRRAARPEPVGARLDPAVDDLDRGRAGPLAPQEVAVVLGDGDDEGGVVDEPGEEGAVDVDVVGVGGEAVGDAGEPAADPGAQRRPGRVVRVDVLEPVARSASRACAAASGTVASARASSAGRRAKAPGDRADRGQRAQGSAQSASQPSASEPARRARPVQAPHPGSRHRVDGRRDRRVERHQLDLAAPVRSARATQLPQDERLGDVREAETM